MYVKPQISRMDLQVEHCMCCALIFNDNCVVDTPFASPATIEA